MNDKELARAIINGAKFTLCEPERVTRKMRFRKGFGTKYKRSSVKGKANKTGLPPKLAVYFEN